MIFRKKYKKTCFMIILLYSTSQSLNIKWLFHVCHCARSPIIFASVIQTPGFQRTSLFYPILFCLKAALYLCLPCVLFTLGNMSRVLSLLTKLSRGNCVYSHLFCGEEATQHSIIVPWILE